MDQGLTLKIHLKALLFPQAFPFLPSRAPTAPQFNFAQQNSRSRTCLSIKSRNLLRVGTLCYLLCVPSTWPGMWHLVNICFKWHVTSLLWSHWSLFQFHNWVLPAAQAFWSSVCHWGWDQRKNKKTTWGIDSQPLLAQQSHLGTFKKYSCFRDHGLIVLKKKSGINMAFFFF